MFKNTQRKRNSVEFSLLGANGSILVLLNSRFGDTGMYQAICSGGFSEKAGLRLRRPVLDVVQRYTGVEIKCPY